MVASRKRRLDFPSRESLSKRGLANPRDSPRQDTIRIMRREIDFRHESRANVKLMRGRPLLKLELSAPRGFPKMLGCTVRQGLDCGRRLLTSRSDQTATVDDEEIGDLMGTVPAVHHARLRIVAHTTRAHQVTGIGRVGTSWIQPDFGATGSLQNLFLPCSKKVHGFQIVGLISECNPDGG